MRDLRLRVGLVAVVALASLALVESEASATCVVVPMQQVLKDSDAVWWAQVTDSTVAKPIKWEGTWKLTVRLDDVLKGPGRQGSTATVIASGCGPPTLPQEQVQAAPGFIGERRLFLGDINEDGALDAFSQVLSPTGLSPEQQYGLALRLTGHNPGVPDDAKVPGESPWPLVPWVLGLAAFVVALVGVIVLLRRRAVQHSRT